MGEGTDTLKGGFGVPLSYRPGQQDANEKQEVEPPSHPAVLELRRIIGELKEALHGEIMERNRLIKQIEAMVVQAKEGL